MPVPVEGAYYRVTGLPGFLFTARRDDTRVPGRWCLDPVPLQAYVEDGSLQIKLRNRATGFVAADLVGPL